jgi:hypothetical protein
MDAWSTTRARTFQECRRKFYYRYCLAPAGRAPDGPAEAREAHTVKDLIGLDAWAGQLVHSLIELVLGRWKAGRDWDEAELARLARKRLSEQFRASQAYWVESADHFPRRPPLLDMHYFSEGGVSRDRAEQLLQTVSTALRNFVRSDLARRIRAAGSRNWLPIDRNAAARLDDGLLILVKPDFAFRLEGDLTILDWKTGQPDPMWTTIQVTCYALYAAEQWNHPLERIHPRVVTLCPELRVSDADYSLDRLPELQRIIRETHREMQHSLEADAPLDLRFPLTEDAGRCRWCCFRGLCEGGRRSCAG